MPDPATAAIIAALLIAVAAGAIADNLLMARGNTRLRRKLALAENTIRANRDDSRILRSQLHAARAATRRAQTDLDEAVTRANQLADKLADATTELEALRAKPDPAPPAAVPPAAQPTRVWQPYTTRYAARHGICMPVQRDGEQG